MPGILSDTELMEQLNIDPTRWRITRVQYDRRDTYKGDTINPMINVKVSLEPKVAEIAVRDLFAGLLEDAKAFSPKYPKISYPKQSEGLLYELAMPDIHLGLLAWAEESGTDSDLKITEALVNTVTDRLLSHVRGMSVSRILFPVGNDYFNVNDKKEETIHGTRQQEDTRWQKTFRKGHQLMVQQIDKLQTVAPEAPPT